MYDQFVPPTSATVREANLGVRLTAGALVVVMALGSVALWTAVPLGVLWLAAALAKTATAVYLIALVACPTTMVLFGWGLSGVNALYLRVTGRPASDETASRLLETMVVVSAVVGMVALLVWWLFFAGPPTSTPWPDEVSGQGN